jgi:trans-2,3-dihydro-3-hydroxyanthranilate isomerase
LVNEYEFVTLDVFTNQRFGGNPLAIFPDARGLSDVSMQMLARELNMSEVAFLLPPADPQNDARVRIFTTVMEIGFAGHPNVGVAWFLAQRGRVKGSRVRLEQAAGLVDAQIHRIDGELRSCMVRAPQPVALGDPPSRKELAACVSLPESDIGEPMLSSVALSTVCVPVNEQALRSAACNVDAFRAIASRRPDLAQMFLLSLYCWRERDREIDVRVFAPLSGTIEDPATGSAAAALAGGLLHRQGGDDLAVTIRQGQGMGRPSTMAVSATRHAGTIRAWIGGECVPVLRGFATV